MINTTARYLLSDIHPVLRKLSLNPFWPLVFLSSGFF